MYFRSPQADLNVHVVIIQDNVVYCVGYPVHFTISKQVALHPLPPPIH